MHFEVMTIESGDKEGEDMLQKWERQALGRRDLSIKFKGYACACGGEGELETVQRRALRAACQEGCR